MHFSFISLLPVLGNVISSARKHAEAARVAGVIPTKDQLAAFVETQLESFDPKVDGESGLHAEEKHELARAFAGLTLNIIGAERKKHDAKLAAEHAAEGRKP
jgi:hypothetical protein